MEVLEGSVAETKILMGKFEGDQAVLSILMTYKVGKKKIYSVWHRQNKEKREYIIHNA